MTHKEMSPEMESCIKECQDCYRVCLETKIHCLELGEEHADASHIAALSDCLELCNLSAHFMIKGSVLHQRVCEVCSEACEVCALSCDTMPDDAQMRECADVCRKCETSCRSMSELE